MVRSNAGLREQPYTLPKLLVWETHRIPRLDAPVRRRSWTRKSGCPGGHLDFQSRTSFGDYVPGLVPSSEDAVSAGADNAASHYQDDPKKDLTLYQLHDANDYQNRCNDPQNSAVHVASTVSY
jgi:hypothetical protein